MRYQFSEVRYDGPAQLELLSNEGWEVVAIFISPITNWSRVVLRKEITK